MISPSHVDARETVIEGSLREVALADVLQLLDLGRKTGVLRVVDGLGARRARVRLVNGRVLDAEMTPWTGAPDAREIVIELLGWTSGRFAVEPLDAHERLPARAVTLGVDAVLMEAARRADEWARLADRVPGPHAAPRLAAPGVGGGPLALEPGEWEVLAHADGALDLRAIAARTRRDLLVVARAVHRLIGEGFLAVGPEVEDRVPREGARSSLD